MTDTCCFCEEPLGSYTVIMRDSKAHRSCYEIMHPPQYAQAFVDVARGFGDALLAASVLQEFVPPGVQARIIEVYNDRLNVAWQKRCVWWIINEYNERHTDKQTTA